MFHKAAIFLCTTFIGSIAMQAQLFSMESPTPIDFDRPKRHNPYTATSLIPIKTLTHYATSLDPIKILTHSTLADTLTLILFARKVTILYSNNITPYVALHQTINNTRADFSDMKLSQNGNQLTLFNVIKNKLCLVLNPRDLRYNWLKHRSQQFKDQNTQ